jgi:hypothetical protein
VALNLQFTTILPDEKKRKRFIVIALLSMCILLCGFTWDWFIEFTMRAIFPIEDAISTDMILQFEDYVDVSDLQIYLTEPLIAEQMIDGIHSNISANVYTDIELPDMRQESIGKRILRIIFDRLFT